jgi:NADH dehydrogenase
LVLGGGFAGIAAVSTLRRAGAGRREFTVELVDRERHSVFSPLLPDLISRKVRPEHIAYPLEPFCRRLGVPFHNATVLSIEPELRQVETDRGVFTADVIIVCLGCETNYFGDNNIRRHAPGLKTIPEVMSIETNASRIAGTIQLPLSAAAGSEVLVVGGGYTGFEVAAHFVERVRRATGLSGSELTERLPVVILEKSDAVLRGCSPAVRRWAQTMMERMGVRIRTGITVQEIGDGGAVQLTDGSVCRDASVIWTAGVAPGPAIEAMGPATVGGGRLAVDPFLRLEGTERILAAGDVAGPIMADHAGPLRMGVQFSLSGGRCAATNVVRMIRGKRLREFRPFDPGYVVPLGPEAGAGRVLGMEVHGRLPSMLHYVMCIMRSWSWRDRRGLVRDLFQGGW